MMKIVCLMLALCLWTHDLLALEGKVVKVHDGDTLTILDNNKAQYKIRLAQIDAPELGQSWGRNSRQVLSSLVINKNVSVSVVDTDRYGRTVGTVYLGELDICRVQVATGNAWVYRQYLTDASLLDDEEQAKSEQAGLWSESDPIPLWEWRRSNR